MATRLLPHCDDSVGWGALQKALKAAAFSAVRDGQIAADSAQQTICEVFESGGNDAKGQPMGVPLLIMRAVSRAKDSLRRKSRESKALDLAAEQMKRLRHSPILKHIDDPLKLLTAADLMLRVHQFLEDLDPPERREMLRMVFVEGLTYDEVCKRSPMPKATARSRVFHGLKTLRDRLEAEGLMDLLREELS